MDKLKAAIIGTGNIGSDLLMKTLRSEYIKCALFVGRNQNSKGIVHAKNLGIKTSPGSIDALQDYADDYEIVFDATNAEAHLHNIEILRNLKKFTINLTPSSGGAMCVPVVNIEECLDKEEVNLISCGGQATIPIAYVIKQLYPDIEYIENVTAIASKSAGPATRVNIDEYVRTTQNAIKTFSGVEKAKVILNLNPAVPPINMHNTTYAEVKEEVDIPLLTNKIKEMVKKIKKYVPGYNLFLGPINENGVITIMNEITGSGDYLPQYAGNLDIMTCAAIGVAEEYAKKMIKSRG